MQIPPDYQDKDYLVFSSVRNPYERMASHYLHRHRFHTKNVGHWTFYEYIDYLVNNRLHWWGLAGDPPAAEWLKSAGCTHMLKFESLQDDWNKLPAWERAGFIPQLAKRNANRQQDRGWRHMYTREIAQRVFIHQETDFLQFGYHPDSWQIGFREQVGT